MAWEYQDLTIPLNLTQTITVRGPLTDRAEEARIRREVRERYGQIVLGCLQRLAQEGWEPEHPTDFEAVSRAGRLEVATTFEREATTFAFGELRALTITHHYESVAIRLRRAAP